MKSYPKEYIEYLVYFHADRDYFECHEVLEEYWKENPGGGLSRAWVGLIQVAVGVYHHRRNNLKGAAKMLNSAIANLSVDHLVRLGIDANELITSLKERLDQIMHRPDQKFTDLVIPLKDGDLLQHCINEASKKQIEWLRPSDLFNRELIHKHTLRDRSDVISTRLAELNKRKRRKGV